VSTYRLLSRGLDGFILTIISEWTRREWLGLLEGLISEGGETGLLGSESRLAVSDERHKKDYISTWIERKRAEKYKIN